MDALIDLKKIDDLDSLDADYSFEWQEDANEMIDGINKYVEQTLASLEAESYQNAFCSLTSLKIRLQHLNGTIKMESLTILSYCTMMIKNSLGHH
ncbi:hypothetical protein [Psychrobacter glacincola]|uniref:hypothetical protein n=1 Tax=Psychrobacter glacincola TaxID=56810 RepID=UPI0019183ECD|nr:hypothetical protein [Psychrobacter glacincola]